jgi:hypothetical protein
MVPVGSSNVASESSARARPVKIKAKANQGTAMRNNRFMIPLQKKLLCQIIPEVTGGVSISRPLLSQKHYYCFHALVYKVALCILINVYKINLKFKYWE